MHLSEAVVIDEIGSVSVDQSVEGETVLPAVGQKQQMSGRQKGDHMTRLSALQATIIPTSSYSQSLLCSARGQPGLKHLVIVTLIYIYPLLCNNNHVSTETSTELKLNY